MSNSFVDRNICLNTLKKLSRIQVKEFIFLLRLDAAYIEDNACVTQLGIYIIEQVELQGKIDAFNSILDKYEIPKPQTIEYEKIDDSGLPMNEVNKFKHNAYSKPSIVNDLTMFTLASTPENLKGICLSNLIRILEVESTIAICFFLIKLISFLRLDKREYLNLINLLVANQELVRPQFLVVDTS